MIIVLAVPFLAPFPWILANLLSTGQTLLTPQALPTYVDFPRLIKTYGYLPIGLCMLGVLVLALRSGKKNYGLLLGLLAMLAMLVTFFTFHYGISIVYERGLMFTMLMVGIVAGAGLMAVKNFSEWLTIKAGVFSYVMRYLGWFFCLVLVGVTLFIGIPDRQHIPYYQMINDGDYQAFVWIKENVGEGYDRAILDPWKATPFTAITGKKVYTRIHAFPKPSDEEARRFLEAGCSDTAFLKQNGISIIYTEGECRNPDLTQVSKNIYLLREAKSGG
jgi:hypothetical protein